MEALKCIVCNTCHWSPQPCPAQGGVSRQAFPELQQAAEQVVAEALKGQRRGGPSQAALVALRPDGSGGKGDGGPNVCMEFKLKEVFISAVVTSPPH